MKVPRSLIRYEPTIELLTKTFTANYNLIWGIATVSGIAAGWSSYYSRKYHRERLEEKISDMNSKLLDMESNVKQKYFYRWTVPLFVIGIGSGYYFGRLHSSYRSIKYMNMFQTNLMHNFNTQLKAKNVNNYQAMDEMLQSVIKDENAIAGIVNKDVNEVEKGNSDVNGNLSLSYFNPKLWLKKK